MSRRTATFVIYAGDKPIWHSDTKGRSDVRLVIQDDRTWCSTPPTVSFRSSSRPTPRRRPLWVEAEVVEVAPVAVEKKTHTVVAGDTLFNIAGKQYPGDGNRWYMELAPGSSTSPTPITSRSARSSPSPDPESGINAATTRSVIAIR